MSAKLPLIAQLNQRSAAYGDPVTRVPWDRLSESGVWLPPEAVSLAGLPEFAGIDSERQELLSRLEFLNFLEGGLWLEAMFMERTARALRGRRNATLAERKYRTHEIREEAGHSLMFLELMERAGHVPSARAPLSLPFLLFSRGMDFESPEFWLAATLAEEVPDQMNRYVRRHAETVNPVIAEICLLHVIEEARHVAYAREALRHKAARITSWRRKAGSVLMSRLLKAFVSIFYYPRAELYETAGLRPGAHWARLARDNPHRHAFVRSLVEPSLRLLRPLGYDLYLR